MNRSYSSYLRSRPISSVSRKPAVVSRPRACALAFDQGVGEQRGGVHNAADARRFDPVLAQQVARAGHSAARRVVRSGALFPDAGVAGVGIECHQVSEGPADVDAEREWRCHWGSRSLHVWRCPHHRTWRAYSTAAVAAMARRRQPEERRHAGCSGNPSRGASGRDMVARRIRRQPGRSSAVGLKSGGSNGVSEAMNLICTVLAACRSRQGDHDI